jgi:hypothetical protein
MEKIESKNMKKNLIVLITEKLANFLKEGT